MVHVPGSTIFSKPITYLPWNYHEFILSCGCVGLSSGWVKTCSLILSMFLVGPSNTGLPSSCWLDIEEKFLSVVLSQYAQFHIIRENAWDPKFWRTVEEQESLLWQDYPLISRQTFVHLLHTLSALKILIRNSHQILLTAARKYAHWICSDAPLVWCIDGRPAPTGASWLRAACYSRTRTRGCREEEEGGGRRGGGGEKSTFSTAWMDSNRGGEKGKARKGILKWSICANTRGRDETHHVSRVNNWSGWGQHMQHDMKMGWKIENDARNENVVILRESFLGEH